MQPLVFSLLAISLLPSLFSCALTASAALALAPRLLEHRSKLEDALNDYKRAQVQIAAIKLKSLLPPTSALNPSQIKASLAKDSDSDDSKSSDGSDDDDDDDSSDVENVPTAAALLSVALIQLLKSLDPPSIDEINSLDFATPQSQQDFIAAKELEAFRKLQESLVAIRDIQTALHISPSPTSPADNVTAKLLARLVAKLDALEEEYEDVASLQKRLKSSKEEKRSKAQKELAETQAKMQEIIQRLSEIISE